MGQQCDNYNQLILIAITCGELVLDAIVNITGNEVGDMAKLSCVAGYQVSSQAILTCNSSGHWEGKKVGCESKSHV